MGYNPTVVGLVSARTEIGEKSLRSMFYLVGMFSDDGYNRGGRGWRSRSSFSESDLRTLSQATFVPPLESLHLAPY